MKKIIFLILTVGSIYAGYIFGIHPNTTNTPVQTATALLADTQKQIFLLLSSEEILNTASDKNESLKSKIMNVTDFKNQLESRIHRDEFTAYKDINPLVIKALIDTEDRRFYEHGALDIIGVIRAAITNYMAGSTLEGGSTISQQVVKNVFLSNERTFTRKIEELFLAVQLERTYTKDEILEIYLNTIYFGHGTYGIREASQTYFNKTPDTLNLAQCAMLAGLPQAPSAYDPIDNPEEGFKRMVLVLTLMSAAGDCTAAEAAVAPTMLWNK